MTTQLILEFPHANVQCPYCGTKKTVDFKVEEYVPTIKNALGHLAAASIPYKCPQCKCVSLYNQQTFELTQLNAKQQDYLRSFFPFKMLKFVGGVFKTLPSFHDHWLATATESFGTQMFAWWILSNGNTIPVSDAIHGTVVLRNPKIFHINDLNTVIKDLDEHEETVETQAANYVVNNGLGVRCGVRPVMQHDKPSTSEYVGHIGYVDGRADLINAVKNRIYVELISNGVSLVGVDTIHKKNRALVEIKRFKNIVYSH